MPRERGKSKRGARYYNTLTRRNRITPSQQDLIAPFASPRYTIQRSQKIPHSAPPHLHGIISVKDETPSSCAYFPLSIPPLLHGLRSVKEEAPPSCARPPLATNILVPPTVNQDDPYYDDGSCMVEEEIPPSWKLEDNAMTTKDITTEVAGKEEEEEQPQQFVNRLMEEHLQLLFEIKKKQDGKMHSQSILGQRMDILFDALVDAPARGRCPTCGQWFTPVYTIHGQPSSKTE